MKMLIALSIAYFSSIMVWVGVKILEEGEKTDLESEWESVKIKDVNL